MRVICYSYSVRLSRFNHWNPIVLEGRAWKSEALLLSFVFLFAGPFFLLIKKNIQNLQWNAKRGKKTNTITLKEQSEDFE